MRDLLCIVPGSDVCFKLAPGGRVMVSKADDQSQPPSRFARLCGTADAGMSTEEITALTRGRDEGGAP